MFYGNVIGNRGGVVLLKTRQEQHRIRVGDRCPLVIDDGKKNQMAANVRQSKLRTLVAMFGSCF